MNAKLVLCNLLFTTSFLLVFLALGFITSENRTLDASFLLYSINAFSFSIVALALSYVCGIILKGSNTMSLVSTLASLAFAFLGGVFVPQEVLTEGVLKIAQFVPSYWYVLASYYSQPFVFLQI